MHKIGRFKRTETDVYRPFLPRLGIGIKISDVLVGLLVTGPNER